MRSLPPGGPAGGGPLGGSDIPAFRYARAAEMAGRAGRDRAGEVFVLAPQGNRPDPPRPGAWDGPPAPASALEGLRRGWPLPRPDIAAHLLRMAGEDSGGATLDGIMHRLSRTWFLASSGAAAAAALAVDVEGMLEDLAELGLVERRRGGDGRRRTYSTTRLGRRACRSPLPALEAARAVRGLKRSRREGRAGATQFYLDALRAAWSIAGCGPGGPTRGAASGSGHGCGLLERYGWQERAGADSAEEGPEGLHLALAHYAFAAERPGGGMPASRLVAAGGAAADTARALLELADLARDPADQEGDI